MIPQTPEFGQIAFEQSASQFPLVSVIVSNYNYEYFLKEAVDSALDQTYPNVEVIVVDDGSSDGSRRVITGYKRRIVSVLQENRGQASSCNAGFQASRGEIVIFLDADDVLLPNSVEKMVAAFQSKPGVAKVQCRQRLVDANTKATGDLNPPAEIPMLSGDMRQSMMAFGSYAWPATSGNAFARAVLRRIMPIPEHVYRGLPDIYLCSLSAMFGEVISLEELGGLYRVHGENSWFRPRGSVDLDVWRRELLATDDTYIRVKDLFSTLYSVNTQNIRHPHQTMHYLCRRMSSLKLDRQNHPFKETLWTLFVRGCVLSVTDSDSKMPMSTRLFNLLWFTAMLLAPRPLCWSLAQVLTVKKRNWLRDQLLSLRKG